MITEGLDEYLKKFFVGAESELVLFSAYCTSSAIKTLLSEVSEDIHLKFITRWAKEDILQGASNLESYNAIREMGGIFYRHPNLHIKMFIRDKKKKILGSANLTSRGVGLNKNQNNIEALTNPRELSQRDILYMNSVIKRSIKVTPEMVDKLHEQLSELEVASWMGIEEGTDDELGGIFVNDFPFLQNPDLLIDNPFSKDATHDKVVFSLPKVPTTEGVKEGFLGSDIKEWLDNNIGEGKSFGELSSLIHDALLDVPKPYRKKVKKLQSNLYNWIKELEVEAYEFYKPGGKSEVIKKSNGRNG